MQATIAEVIHVQGSRRQFHSSLPQTLSLPSFAHTLLQGSTEVKTEAQRPKACLRSSHVSEGTLFLVLHLSIRCQHFFLFGAGDVLRECWSMSSSPPYTVQSKKVHIISPVSKKDGAPSSTEICMYKNKPVFFNLTWLSLYD